MNPWWRDADPSDLAPLVALAGFLFLVIVWVVAVIGRESRELVRRRVLAQLALATERGLPLVPALQALAHDLERPFGRRFAWIAFWVRRQRRRDAEEIADVAAVLQEGDLGKALAEAPRCFPAPLPELLGTAEREGTLGPALAAVRDLDGEAERFRAQVRSRLVYPVAVLAGVSQPAAFLLVFALPKLDLIGETLGEAVPPAVALASAVRPVVSLAVPLLLLGLWLAAAALVPGSRAARLLRVWPFRRVRESTRAALLARTLAAFLRAGATVPEALRAAGEGDAARRASEGASLAAALSEGRALPASTAASLETATRGDAPLARALEVLAEEETLENRARVEALARAVLPLALAALGLLVASYYWPTFLQLQSLRRVVLW